MPRVVSGGRADADAARHPRLLRVVRHRVLVHRDAAPVERLLGHLAGEAAAPQVHQHQVVVGAARDQVEAARRAASAASACGVLDHAPLVGREAGRERLAEAHRLGGDHVHQRPALQAREHGLVELLRAPAAREHDSPPRGPRSVLCVVLVTRSACGTGLGCSPAATSPAMCAMSTTSAAPTSAAIAREALEVDDARVGAGAGDDDARPVLARERSTCVVVDAPVLGRTPYCTDFHSWPEK